MKMYKVIFTNCPSWIGRASSRNDAIKMASISTRGYLSVTAQSKNVVSAKLYKDV